MTDRRSQLRQLLAYATLHRHSRFWIAPLTRLLSKGGPAHG
jgi:hypothetical protein